MCGNRQVVRRWMLLVVEKIRCYLFTHQISTHDVFFFFSLYSTAVERDPGLGFERELSALLRSIHDTLCNATLVAKVWCLAEVWKCSVCSMCSMCSMRAHKQALNHKMFICKGVLRTLHMYNAGFIGLYGVDAGQ